MAYIKFGIGRTTSDAAHEIRDGHITREEGVQLVKKFDHEIPSNSMQITLDYLNISREDLEQITDAFRDRNKNLWNKTNQGWDLKHAVYNKNFSVLAISYGHEANASIMVNGKLIASVAEERFTKKVPDELSKKFNKLLP